MKQRGGWPKYPKFKGKNKATFFSPSENRCLPAPSNLETEEREFVVDSGASMHIISKKDLNSAEMDTLTKSCSPTIVITAKELDIFLTMKVLENTPAVLSLGKLCDENGYRDSDSMQHENFVPIVVPGLSTSSSSGSHPSTTMTPSRQERNHPTTTTVLSDSDSRK